MTIHDCFTIKEKGQEMSLKQKGNIFLHYFTETHSIRKVLLGSRKADGITEETDLRLLKTKYIIAIPVT